MFDIPIQLQNNFVLLRPLIKTDYTEFKHIKTHSDIWIYFTSDLSDSEQLYKWVDDALSQMHNKSRLAFTIEIKPENKIIGSSSFMNISDYDQRLEIGATWIAPNYQGKGFNNHIKYLMIEYAFESLNFERVEFKTDVLNMAARKALTRIGAKEEGVLRSHTLMTRGRRRDTIYYSILKNDWPDIKIRLKNLTK